MAHLALDTFISEDVGYDGCYAKAVITAMIQLLLLEGGDADEVDMWGGLCNLCV